MTNHEHPFNPDPPVEIAEIDHLPDWFDDALPDYRQVNETLVTTLAYEVTSLDSDGATETAEGEDVMIVFSFPDDDNPAVERHQMYALDFQSAAQLCISILARFTRVQVAVATRDVMARELPGDKPMTPPTFKSVTEFGGN